MMTVGELLRRKREEKQISLEQVSMETNIRIAYLKAIENDQVELIPSVSQARGFTRLYAEYLGLNARSLFEDVEKINHPLLPVTTEPDEFPIGQLREKGSSSLPDVEKKLRGKKKTKQVEAEPLQEETTKPISQAVFEEIGIELKNQREALGLSREDVERQLKIREFYLYSLEIGNIDDLPSTVQGRGMLNNYASFMNLNAESMQIRFAEGLQQRRLERNQIEADARKDGKPVMGKEPLSGWRRILTPDLLIGGSVLAVLFFLVVWGAIQVIRTSGLQAPVPTISSISEVLVGTEEEGTPDSVLTPEIQENGQTSTPVLLNTPGVDLQATINSISSGSIQVVVVAYQRTYMRITVDGREVFADRVVPGNVYTYSGSKKITLLTGNAAGLQVYYNQQDQGILGPVGQVAALEFTATEIMTPTPRFTPSPTATQRPTLTALPTKTPLPTATVPTVTITPAIP